MASRKKNVKALKRFIPESTCQQDQLLGLGPVATIEFAGYGAPYEQGVDWPGVTCAPKALNRMKRWVATQSQCGHDGSMVVIPVDPETELPIDASDPSEWRTAKQLDAIGDKHFLEFGAGVYVNSTDGIVEIVFEGCYDRCEPVPEVDAIVRKIASYSEVLPGCQGVHILVSAATCPFAECTWQNVHGAESVTIRACSRLVPFTGISWNEFPEIEPRQQELDEFVGELMQPRARMCECHPSERAKSGRRKKSK